LSSTRQAGLRTFRIVKTLLNAVAFVTLAFNCQRPCSSAFASSNSAMA
jgi:hypothetical protein